MLLNAVKGIADLITQHGLINLDFADIRTIMNEMGAALMGSGVGVGENNARDAAQAAVSSPLLEDVSIEGARGVLINITGNADITMHEVTEAMTLVQEAAHDDANVIIGTAIDDALPPGERRVTVIATGLADAAPTGVEDEVERENGVRFSAMRGAGENGDGGDVVVTEGEESEDYLDIPAFIRNSRSREGRRKAE